MARARPQLELVERLCRSVAIVNDGRLVASGPVEELRRKHASRMLRVEVEGGSEDWWSEVAGVAGAGDREGAGVLLELHEGADDQQVLAAAARAGRVRHFGRAEARLADIFREAISA